MKRNAVILLVMVMFGGSISTAQAQNSFSSGSKNFARHGIFLELGGNGFLYSVNYDYKLADHVSVRVGGMYIGARVREADTRASMVVVPITANYLVGSGSSRLELGVGVTLARVGGDLGDSEGPFEESGLGSITSTIGYRLQPRDGGFLFRIGFTPHFNGDSIEPWAGLSLGATF